MWKVSYIHLKGYRVSRTYDTKEAAQEFISVNAMVCALPGVRLIEMTPDGVIAAITEASTDAVAMDIMRVVPRSLVLAVADQLSIEADGHATPYLCRVIVNDARA